MTLIDRDSIFKQVEPYLNRGTSYGHLLQILTTITTIDAVEVVHGAWEPVGELNDVIHKCADGNVVFGLAGWKFCPNCGAKMDGHKKDVM